MELFFFLGGLVHLLWPLAVVIIGGTVAGAYFLYVFVTDIPFQVREFRWRRKIMKLDPRRRARYVRHEWKSMTPMSQNFYAARGVSPDTNYGMPEGEEF